MGLRIFESMKTYSITLELLQQIANILQELPYKTSSQVLNTLNKVVVEQDTLSQIEADKPVDKSAKS